MTTDPREKILADLKHAFRSMQKPEPLTSYEGSYDDEAVDYFNAVDWENATYQDFADGEEGWIISAPATYAYLTPHLLRILILQLSGKYEGAVDNIAEPLESRLIDSDVSDLFSDRQKLAVLAAWAYLDGTVYAPSGSETAKELARHWGIAGF
jgi:hypothetical protein